MLVRQWRVVDGVLRVDVSGVSGREVAGAMLRLYSTEGSTVTGGTIFPVADNTWDEQSVTWNTAPAACLGAFYALGAFRLAVETPVSLELTQGYATGSFLWIINNIYFQYYSLFIFIVSAATMVIVSYLTPEPAPERLVGLTFATVTPEQRQQSRASWTRGDVLSSAFVLVLILAAYLYFRG